MKVKDFIFKESKNNFVLYDKQFYIMLAKMNFIKADNGQIYRITNFYKIKLDETAQENEIIFSCIIKTNLFKNYIALINLKTDENKQTLIYKCKSAIKGNKQNIIDYQKAHESEYIQRDLNQLILAIKEQQNNIIANNEKWRKSKLKNYDELFKTLNNIKPREREIFTLKMIDSQSDFISKDYLKCFLKWTKSNQEPRIKRAIIYILKNDLEKGINYYIGDFDFRENEYNKKWQTRLYYRDLYLSLFERFLKESNGDKERAKELTIKEIESKHTRPKELRIFNYH